MNYRKLPKNTVFDGGAANVLLALRGWFDNYGVDYGVRNDFRAETCSRIQTAVNALGMMLLETVEAAYEPLPRKFRVTTVARKVDESVVTVEAADETEARRKARQTVLDAAFEGTLVDAVHVQEVAG